MRWRIIAIGTRSPAWIKDGINDYLRRFAADFKLSISEIEAGKRSGKSPQKQPIAAEAKALTAQLRDRGTEYVVALDERGALLTTRELAQWLAARLQDGRDVAFVLGGPDGLAPELSARAELQLSLSRMTLPHALARLLLVEQLYRAHSILKNHPYHRD
jgi:23S rRNA (pseudouridine1915-N3)-methyltransferase